MAGMYVETKEELIALLNLIGYTEAIRHRETDDAWHPTMVHDTLPWVRLIWLNGCKMHNCKDFLTFNNAWLRIQQEIGNDK